MHERLVLTLISVFLLTACQEDNSKLVYDSPEKPAISLTVASVTRQNVPLYYSATGYTKIARSIEISTSQSGTIVKLDVEEGDVVKAGALLIKIDEADLLTTIKQAKSAIESATINFKDRQLDLNTAKQLRKTKLIPAEQFRKTQVQLALANAQLVQANSELSRQQARKPYYQITSPIEARVVKRWVSQGDLAVAGKPLLQLEAIKGLEFETALPVQWIDKIKIGAPYQIQLHNKQTPISAVVSHVVHSVNRITQTCPIKLSLADASNLTAGMSGQIDFTIANENPLVIPESSLISKAGVQGVYRLDENNHVFFTPVKTERRWQRQRVIISGLVESESIVLNPTPSLHNGSLIEIKTP